MKIIFFDGFCSLCNGWVDWVIRRDTKHQIKYASLQGESAKTLLPASMNLQDTNTVIYLRDGAIYQKSTAIFMILWDLQNLWRLTSVFLILPKFLRDFFYNLIAINRYRLFGRRDTCRMPTAQEKNQFLP